MSKLRSKCHGAKIYEEANIESPYTEFYHREICCSKCHKPCELKKTRKSNCVT